MTQSSSSSTQGPSGSGNQLIAGIRNRRVYEDIYQKGANDYLPYNVKNTGRYMGFIRGQPKIKPPRQNVTFENITARVGNGKLGDARRAQQKALADQVAPGLINIVGRLAKDIKRVKALVNEQSAQNWITDRGLKDWKVQTEDLDLDPNTPKNVIVTNPSGFYSIDGYRAVEPKQRFMLNQYYGKYPTKLSRADNSYGSWYDQTIRPLIPAAVGKQLFNKAVQIALKSMGHMVEENHGITNQANRRKQQLTFLRLAPFLWKMHFIGQFAAANAPEQSKQTFMAQNYFNMYGNPLTRKQYEAINKQAINVFNAIYSGKPLSELTQLYDAIKQQITLTDTAIQEGGNYGFEFNFEGQKIAYETIIRIMSHAPPTQIEKDEEVDQEQLAAIQQSLDEQKQQQQY
ncbi:MAG: hypothetical protein EZS28_017920 [Streblomastix strix]|uniref:Uncharacterized protein n=1 Tax=Streblomastix strix TaxID=222440 RepID=A0A5J4VVJ5_9EUKA|nr:MAG: hypothetical protein EZS28_017920 [Streblomastix strix]